MSEQTFYHYTCGHGATGIRRSGTVLPLGLTARVGARLPQDIRWMARVCWFTDLTEPDAAALGLTSITLSCDRTEWRVTVADAVDLVPWSNFARGVVSRDQRDGLEEGRRPAHWWISEKPVPVDLASFVRSRVTA